MLKCNLCEMLRALANVIVPFVGHISDIKIEYFSHEQINMKTRNKKCGMHKLAGIKCQPNVMR